MTEREQGHRPALGGSDWPYQSLPDTRLDARLDAFTYRIIDTPLDEMLIARTDAGLVRVAFAREGFAQVIEYLTEKLHPRPAPARQSLDDAARAIEAYFAGAAKTVPLALDLQLAIGFRRAVVDHLPSIAYGSTASYSQVAAAVGRPGSAHAVGVACRSNPLPIVLPCHRAVRSDGSIGGYVGGTEAKRVLLALEAA